MAFEAKRTPRSPRISSAPPSSASNLYVRCIARKEDVSRSHDDAARDDEAHLERLDGATHASDRDASTSEDLDGVVGNVVQVAG